MPHCCWDGWVGRWGGSSRHWCLLPPNCTAVTLDECRPVQSTTTAHLASIPNKQSMGPWPPLLHNSLTTCLSTLLPTLLPTTTPPTPLLLPSACVLPAAGLVGWVVPAQSNHSTEPWACPPAGTLGALCCTASRRTPPLLSAAPPLDTACCSPVKPVAHHCGAVMAAQRQLQHATRWRGEGGSPAH